ncbi:MAG: diguanylate cyclase [Oscillospiraceae bacterium]|nr:diguanylate cyclase [Oscillospiraceae bacterium]
MDRTRYPVYVQEWMDTIEKSLGVDSERLMEYCDKLMEYAQKNRLDYLKGFALFFRGYGLYSMARLEESMSALSSALNYLVNEEDWYMTARTYNAMGNLADFQGDLSLATDCYCKGLVISREHELGLLSYSISSNISNIHIALGQLEHAVDMLRYCEQLTDEGLVAPITSRIVICANLGTCYTRLKRFNEAKHYLDLLISICGDDRSETTRVIICVLRAELYHALGDAQERDAAIAELNSMKLQSTTIYDALNELCRHALMLLELGKLDEFLALISQIEARVEGVGVEKQVIDLRLKYYKQIGDVENSEKTALRYYEVVELSEGMRNKIVSHNITTRMHLDELSAKRKEIERTNLLLKQKSERDALTGMNNRYKLNEISELAFHRAYTNGTPLTVEILDIDYYKQFNDNYGHQAGDECLVRIAEAIRSMEEYDGVFTARYGGDEFVVIYEDYTMEQVDVMAKMLRQKIHDLNIEHRYSKVADHITISQGLFHRIPAGSNKPWDFLHCADMALYGVKSKSRDSYYIGTSLDDVRKYREQVK